MTGIKKKIICLIIELSAVIAGLAIGSGMLTCGTLTAAAAQDIEGITESVTEDITEADGHRIIYYDKAQIVDASGKADVIEAMKAISADSNVIFYTTDRN